MIYVHVQARQTLKAWSHCQTTDPARLGRGRAVWTGLKRWRNTEQCENIKSGFIIRFMISCGMSLTARSLWRTFNIYIFKKKILESRNESDTPSRHQNIIFRSGICSYLSLKPAIHQIYFHHNSSYGAVVLQQYFLYYQETLGTHYCSHTILPYPPTISIRQLCRKAPCPLNSWPAGWSAIRR